MSYMARLEFRFELRSLGDFSRALRLILESTSSVFLPLYADLTGFLSDGTVINDVLPGRDLASPTAHPFPGEGGIPGTALASISGLGPDHEWAKIIRAQSPDWVARFGSRGTLEVAFLGAAKLPLAAHCLPDSWVVSEVVRPPRLEAAARVPILEMIYSTNHDVMRASLLVLSNAWYWSEYKASQTNDNGHTWRFARRTESEIGDAKLACRRLASALCSALQTSGAREVSCGEYADHLTPDIARLLRAELRECCPAPLNRPRLGD